MDSVTTVNHRVIIDAHGTSASDPPQREAKRVNINTSLSTISPHHHEVMNTGTNPVELGVPGGKPLTMRDVILWHQEQAQRQGELGFTTNFPDPSDIFRPFTLNAPSENELPADADEDSALVAAMQETRKAITQLHQRKIIMDGARPLLAKTEMSVNQNLLAAGVPEQEFANKNLRQKIVQLVELKKPPPKKNFAAILVSVASTTKGRSHVLEVNLPLKACVAEIYALLDEVVKALLSDKRLSYEGGGEWKYQLIDLSRSQVLMDKSLPIKTDLDYKFMLQKMSERSDGKAPVAVLTQGGLARPIDMSEADAKADDGSKAEGDSMSGAHERFDEDDDELQVFDEDGNPYFDPLDMDRLCLKYADMGDDLTGETGIRGFWR